MRTLQTLIDEAVRKCTTSAELARRIGVHRSEITELQSGRRQISPVTVGLLADVLELDGEEARRLAVLAIVAGAKGEKAGVLRRAFFVCWGTGVACGVAMLLHTSDAPAKIAAPTTGSIEASQAIHCRALGWLSRWMLQALRRLLPASKYRVCTTLA